MSTPASITLLAENLSAQAQSGTIAINADLLGIPAFTELVNKDLLRTDGTLYLAVTAATIIPTDPPATGFTITAALPSAQSGFSFLNLADNTVTVTFSTPNGAPPFNLVLNV